MNVGGTSSLLGLVAMAADIEGLYASVKALVCVVRSNKLAAKEMDRIKGYQVCRRARPFSVTNNWCVLVVSSVGSWWRGTVVERWSLVGELSLSCARPAADG